MIVDGVVIEALPSATFRVKLDDNREVLAYVSGKMRLHRISVLPGERVRMEINSATDTRGRIVRRL
ncbi:MAG: translation initiation factor IF-1 [Patescibacteria group bacterium]|nr:translation initiation factor IF-1 [Patescibacteria group bacterium]MDE2144649.1 translation initiation factor IF-1 [Patescibacteria group bacterium]